ncbi:MAG: tRNA (adenosine(37)-N6)-threonylcarbamoyltransferase complex dimerization subunit type 1 TsaB [Lachnospiraceae bacterium]
MKILAIDSSGLVASIAIIEEDQLLGEYTINYKKTHSQTLLPMLSELQTMLELDLSTIDAIAVAGGPGSFTGLRIGSATAKGLGLALDIPLIPIPTLEGMAYNLFGHKDLICPLMDARREQTYTALYRFWEEEFLVIQEQCAVGIEEIISKINTLGQPVVFLGDGVPVFAEFIRAHITVPFHFAPAHLNRQRAAALAVRAFSYYKNDETQTAAEHAPNYLRQSQAERERENELQSNRRRSIHE